MHYYAGLDVSEEATSVCVIDGRGAVVSEAKVRTEPAALAAHLARFEGLMLVGLGGSRSADPRTEARGPDTQSY